MNDPPHTGCDFEATIATLGQKHVLGILRSLGDGRPRRFHELRDGLRVNPRTLTARLVELQRLGVVARKVHHVVPRKVEYDLTPMGRDLIQIFHTLRRWRVKYAVRPVPPTESLSSGRLDGPSPED